MACLRPRRELAASATANLSPPHTAARTLPAAFLIERGVVDRTDDARKLRCMGRSGCAARRPMALDAPPPGPSASNGARHGRQSGPGSCEAGLRVRSRVNQRRVVLPVNNHRGGRCCVQPHTKIFGLPAVPAPVHQSGAIRRASAAAPDKAKSPAAIRSSGRRRRAKPETRRPGRAPRPGPTAHGHLRHASMAASNHQAIGCPSQARLFAVTSTTRPHSSTPSPHTWLHASFPTSRLSPPSRRSSDLKPWSASAA